MQKKSLQHPHNNLFEKTFSNPEVTWKFLKSRLEPSILEKLDPKTLKMESGSFIDDKLKKAIVTPYYVCKTSTKQVL